MEFMADKFDKGCIDRLKMVASTPFVRLSYTEAVEILEESVKNGKKFENEVKWGIDLASEHERYFYNVFFKFLFLLNCVFSLMTNFSC
jgi:asparaginyl-tRNA synthetase